MLKVYVFNLVWKDGEQDGVKLIASNSLKSAKRFVQTTINEDPENKNSPYPDEYEYSRTLKKVYANRKETCEIFDIGFSVGYEC